MSGESLRGPIWEEMRERLSKTPGVWPNHALDELATVAAEFMAGRIGSIARNAQPMIDSAVEDARAAGVKEGWEAAAQWLDEYGPSEELVHELAREMRTRFKEEDDDV